MTNIDLRKRPTLFATLMAISAVAAASACGSLADRDFTEDPSDVAKSDGSGGVSGDGSGGGESGLAGGTATGTGGSSSVPITVDTPSPNPGCLPPKLVDSLDLKSAYPRPYKATSGRDFVLDFGNLTKDCAVLECRRTVAKQPAGDWKECATVGADKTMVRPLSDVEADDPANNGVLSVEIRERFDGAAGPIYAHGEVYIHDSLNGAEKCTLPVTTQVLLSQAKSLFEAVGKGSTSATIAGVKSRNPFVQFNFAPPPLAHYETSTTGKVEFLSLRRHFDLNSGGDVVVMTRAYESRRFKLRPDQTAVNPPESVCWAARMQYHSGGDAPTTGDSARNYYRCDALALNSKGFGICLQVSKAGTVSKAYGLDPRRSGYNNPMNAEYFGGVDHFMWNKLNSRITSRGELRHFSPKCFSSDGICADKDELFLPHRTYLLTP